MQTVSKNVCERMCRMAWAISNVVQPLPLFVCPSFPHWWKQQILKLLHLSRLLTKQELCDQFWYNESADSEDQRLFQDNRFPTLISETAPPCCWEPFGIIIIILWDFSPVSCFSVQI